MHSKLIIHLNTPHAPTYHKTLILVHYLASPDGTCLPPSSAPVARKKYITSCF